jgi:Uma2 family endonuclease
MGNVAPGESTYADLEALPDDQIGQLVFGVLYAHPRAAPAHARASSRLGSSLAPAFDSGGFGAWIILDESEVHLSRHVVVPDLSGWRRERLPEKPKTAYIEVVPDWVCEVLSPSTTALDRGDKLTVYATSGVPYVWLVDPEGQTLEVLELNHAKGRYLLRDVFAGNANIRAVPVDAMSFCLGLLWQW